MIPASATYGVPGADDERIFADIVSSLERDHDDVVRRLRQLATLAAAPSPSSIRAPRRGGQRPSAKPAARRWSPSVRVVLLCYYRDDRVMRSLGLEPRPPFPQGPRGRAGRLVAARPGPQAAEDVPGGVDRIGLALIRRTRAADNTAAAHRPAGRIALHSRGCRNIAAADSPARRRRAGCRAAPDSAHRPNCRRPDRCSRRRRVLAARSACGAMLRRRHHGIAGGVVLRRIVRRWGRGARPRCWAAVRGLRASATDDEPVSVTVVLSTPSFSTSAYSVVALARDSRTQPCETGVPSLPSEFGAVDGVADLGEEDRVRHRRVVELLGVVVFLHAEGAEGAVRRLVRGIAGGNRPLVALDAVDRDGHQLRVLVDE